MDGRGLLANARPPGRCEWARSYGVAVATTNEAVSHTGGPGLGSTWSHRPQVEAILMLADRATRVP
jgi:hypothetical protein